MGLVCRFQFDFRWMSLWITIECPLVMNEISTFILIVISGFKVVGPNLAVGQLSESLAKQRTVPNAIVACVIKLPARSPLVPLWHGITSNTLRPINKQLNINSITHDHLIITTKQLVSSFHVLFPFFYIYNITNVVNSKWSLSSDMLDFIMPLWLLYNWKNVINRGNSRGWRSEFYNGSDGRG